MPELKSEYMTVARLDAGENRTGKWRITSRSSGADLAEIKWYGPWRQYCLFPINALFNATCLESLVDFLRALNKEHHDKRLFHTDEPGV